MEHRAVEGMVLRIFDNAGMLCPVQVQGDFESLRRKQDRLQIVGMGPEMGLRSCIAVQYARDLAFCTQ